MRLSGALQGGHAMLRTRAKVTISRGPQHMRHFRLAALGVVALCGAALSPGNATAMPVGGLANAASQATDVQQAAWVCGPYRCFWRPRYYPYYGAYAYGGPRFYARPYWGYRHHWRRW